MSRESIETAINDCGYQLWRMRKKNKSESKSEAKNESNSD
jgi:hypothetical protein